MVVTMQLLIINIFLTLSFKENIITFIADLTSFSRQHKLIICHWNLNERKLSQVSRTFHRILPNLNVAVVLVLSICPLIFKSSSLFTYPVEIVPCTPNTIGITVTFMFHRFLVL